MTHFARIGGRGSILLLLMSCAQAASANSAMPPPVPPGIERVQPTLRTKPETKVTLGNTSITLEETTLREVVAHVRRGAIEHSGDAGETTRWLCYLIQANGGRERLWFSSGELGGQRLKITAFYATSLVDDADIESCPTLEEPFTSLSIGNSLRLGMADDKLKARLGEPSLRTDDWWFYSYLYSNERASGELDHLVLIGARIKGGRAVSLFVSQTTTN